MGRSKENQKLFDELGEVEYRALKKNNRNLTSKKHYEEHKDEILEYQKGYREEHKEEIKEYHQTPENKKKNFLRDWERRGITFGEMTDSMYYDVIFLPATICMSCEKVFDNTIYIDRKCNDHNNKLKETDPLYICNVRGVICFQCNIHDNWKKRLTSDSIYNQYLIPPLPDTLINTNENSTDKA